MVGLHHNLAMDSHHKGVTREGTKELLNLAAIHLHSPDMGGTRMSTHRLWLGFRPWMLTDLARFQHMN